MTFRSDSSAPIGHAETPDHHRPALLSPAPILRHPGQAHCADAIKTMDQQKTVYGKIDASYKLSPIESLVLGMFPGEEDYYYALDIAIKLNAWYVSSATAVAYKQVAFDSLERLVARGLLVRAGMPRGCGRRAVSKRQMSSLTYRLPAVCKADQSP